MKQIVCLFAMVLLSGVLRAQEGYTVSGKVRGLSADRVFLIAADFGRADTLVSASVTDGSFMLSGSLREGVCAVNLVLAGVEGQLPLLLENTTYQVIVSASGAAVEGEGPAARLYKEFVRIGQDYAAEQNRIRAEYESAGEDANGARLQNLQMLLNRAYETSIRKTHDLLRSNADSYVSAYVIALGIAADDENALRAKYDLLSPQAQATVPGQAIAAALDRYGKLAIGEIAPDFALIKPDGNKFSLHGLKTKWKLVHFWASSNPASRQQNPELVRLYLQYRPKGFEIVSVSLDTDRAAWKNAVGLDGLIWTNGSDLKGPDASEPARLYLVGDLPAFFLLDAENRIVARDLSLADLRVKLADLTKRKKK